MIDMLRKYANGLRAVAVGAVVAGLHSAGGSLLDLTPENVSGIRLQHVLVVGGASAWAYLQGHLRSGS